MSPTNMEDPMIMTIEDLKEAASAKLSPTVRGQFKSSIVRAAS